MNQIGEILRKRREEKKLTIDDVKSDTFISRKYITALEEDRVDGFPAAVYYLGFLKRYAVYLKLNPDELISMYYASLKKQKEEIKTARAAVKSPVNHRLLVVTVVTIVACVIIAALLYTIISEKREAPKPDVEAAKTAAKPAPQPPAHKAAPLILKIDAFKNSWIKVVADDVTEFEGIVYTGDKKEWTAKRRIRLVIGYTKGVNVTFNGSPVDVSKNAKNEVNELNFTAKTQTPAAQ